MCEAWVLCLQVTDHAPLGRGMWFSGPTSFNHEVGRFLYIIATISPDSRLSWKRPAARPWKSPILLNRRMGHFSHFYGLIPSQ